MDVDKAKIRDTLDQAKAFLVQEFPPKLSEADTKAFFVEPIIAALGWDGIGVVIREYYVKNSQEFIDYMMADNGQRLLAMEAKPLQSDLTDKYAAQLVQYCAVEGVEWAALTNGRDLQFFNTFLKPDLEAKRILKLNLLEYSSEEEFETLFDQLSQLSRKNITTPSGSRNWLKQRRMDDILRTVLVDPSSPTIKAMRKALKDGEIDASTTEVVYWVRSFLPSPYTVSRPTGAPNPPTSTLAGDPIGDEPGPFDPMSSTIFKGEFDKLLPAFLALKERIGADATWRTTKVYIAAERDGKTFLAIRRLGGTLVLGLTLAPEADGPLITNNTNEFNWNRMTKITRIADSGDVSDDLLEVVRQAMQHAMSDSSGQKSYYGVTIQNLVDSGVATIGECLLLMKGSVVVREAKFTSSGEIECEGELYPSPSHPDFARALGRQSLNGWTSWFVERPGGRQTIATLRDHLTKRAES